MTRRRRNRTAQLRSERGQTIVEFALVGPILIVLLLAIAQGGIAFNHYLAVTDAARAGSREAIMARISSLSVATIQQTAKDAAGDLNASQVGVTVSDPTDPTLQTSGSSVTVTVTYPYSINLLGWVVSSGNLTSSMTDRLE
ncbi:MAG TPA: TadE/TadG family type IV pilus assembly protein [Gaiellaceae bacterium]|nr:TadE/TadG family type IV pilus assembly protein [Gaiellaceae bacterium]